MEIEILKSLPAGTYFVGDPCYAVPDALWSEFLERGSFVGNEMLRIDNMYAAAVDTMHGDGEYRDAKGEYTFPVDAGLLGVVNVDAIQKEMLDDIVAHKMGAIVTFDTPFKVSVDGYGLVRVGEILIDTDAREDDFEY